MLKLKAVIKPHTLTVGNFNTPLSPMERSIRQKPNREIRKLMEVMNQMDLPDIYRTFYPNRKQYTFLMEEGHWLIKKLLGRID